MAMFSLRKTAQAAAVLLSLAPQNSLDRIKLMKLLYLSDKQSFAEFGTTISGDKLVSLPMGPVLSATLDALQSAPAYAEEFNGWVQNVGPYEHKLAHNFELSKVDLLSRAEIQVLTGVWAEFGGMTGWALVDWTHDPANCPEWNDPDGSRLTITLEELASAVGMSIQEAHEVMLQNAEAEGVMGVLAKL